MEYPGLGLPTARRMSPCEPDAGETPRELWRCECYLSGALGGGWRGRGEDGGMDLEGKRAGGRLDNSQLISNCLSVFHCISFYVSLVSLSQTMVSIVVIYIASL